MRTRFGKRGLLVMILAVLALALVSCGNKEEPEATEQPGPAVQSVGVGERITIRPAFSLSPKRRERMKRISV